MKKVILLITMGAFLFGANGIYESKKYPFCTSERYLNDLIQFSADSDMSSSIAYYGSSKCFLLEKNIKVSGVKTDWGKVSFTLNGARFWGIKEGIK